MKIVEQLIFLVFLVGAVFLFIKNIRIIRRNIFLGKAQNINEQPKFSLSNMIFFALGQKKMFSNPLVAVLHFIIYAGFIIINIEILEIIGDGLFGTHRLLLPMVGPFIYSLFMSIFEVLALLVLVVCIVFLYRRNVAKISRFTKPELNGFPSKDANAILVTEVILMSLFLIMNAADLAKLAKSPAELGHSFTGIISQMLAPLFSNNSVAAIDLIEKSSWWLHILGIFAFLNYLPHSKHLHIVLAFPNAYYSNLTPVGEMSNMPMIEREVKITFQPELEATLPAPEGPMKFGAKDVRDLSWKSLMDAYSCSECGRCTAACPANQTGKTLSPRKIMMDTRDRLTEVGRNIDLHGMEFTDNKALLGDYISVEELRACTTCNACVQECPILISPLNIILELRRSLVMEDSNVPNEWAMMFGNLENNQAPWKFSNDDRLNWTKQ